MNRWLVNQDSECRILLPDRSGRQSDDRPYRLYRFLTDLEDVLGAIADPIGQLQAITALVECLLESSSWLQVMPIQPNPETGWAVVTLYDEPMFPLTVQMVAWAPGVASPIHNHACWGLVALISGQEKNTFWQRSPCDQFPDRIQLKGEQILGAGDIMTFLPDAIHQVTAMGETPTVSFNIYGETDYDRRWEFDLMAQSARIF
jgi:predicted metal-dependent enzyme (double-stranded beta helix superfamily)